MPAVVALTLANSEHLGAAYGASTLGCRLIVLHGYALGIFHFPFGAAFHAVCLHPVHLLLLSIGNSMNDKLFLAECQ